MRSVSRVVRLAAVVALVSSVPACGDDGLEQSKPLTLPDGAAETGGAGLGDGAGAADEQTASDAADSASDAGLDDALADSGKTPSDAGSNDATPDATQGDATGADTGKPDAGSDTANTPFKLVSYTPKGGDALVPTAFTLTLTFSEDLKLQSVDENTVTVTTTNGAKIKGTFDIKGAVATFKPTSPVFPVSAIHVDVVEYVQSYTGKQLSNPVAFSFYTEGQKGLDVYAKLAARYAPFISQGLYDGNAGADLPTRLDADGDWNASNTAGWVTKSPKIPLALGWSVIETQSHWFVTYTAFWPLRNAENSVLAFENDVAGATVIVAKTPAEHPVALSTYFKSSKSGEEMWLWVTEESGLLPAGKQVKDFYLRGVYKVDDLFPKATDTYGCEGIANCTPRRFHAYLAARSHQSCLWNDGGNANAPYLCKLDGAVQSTLKTMNMAPAATGDTIAPPYPLDKKDAKYALYSILEAWYPHRQDAGETALFPDATEIYSPPTDRPSGPADKLGMRFNAPSGNDFGRPPWAWSWKPGSDYYAMPKGTPFFDPPYYLYHRLAGKPGDLNPAMAAWDPVAKTGFSMDFCFQPFWFYDQRSTDPCKP